MEIDWNEAPDWANAVVADEGGRRFYVEGLSGKVKRQAMDGMFDGGVATFPEGHGWSVVEERPWKGEGRPPVGTVCEIHHASWAQNYWQPTDIRYISSDYLIVGGGAFKSEQHFHIADMSFRPIRTAEQIEADAEYEFFDKMHEDLGEACERENLRKLAHYLWKAGYRKVQP